MIVEIVKAIRWFLFIMLLSGMAHWNSFFLLLKQRCQNSESPDGECPHDHLSMLRTMFNTIMWLLFMTGDVPSLEDTDHHGIVVVMFLVSMVAVPLILINMLIAIMGDSYLHMRVRYFFCRFLSIWHQFDIFLWLLIAFQSRSMVESVMLKASILLVVHTPHMLTFFQTF